MPVSPLQYAYYPPQFNPPRDCGIMTPKAAFTLISLSR